MVKKIKGASTEQEALILLPQMETVTKKQRRPRNEATFTDLVNGFHEWESKRVDAGLKDGECARKRGVSLRRMLEYFKLNDIQYPSQVTRLTFDEYILFRKGKRSLTVKTELRDISVFFRSFLQPRGHVTNQLVMEKEFIPQIKVKDDELDANPAVTPLDYKVLNTYIRGAWQKEPTSRTGKYTKQLVWCYVHLLKNSGCRPSEMLRLRRKDVEITNEPRWSESQQEWIPYYKLKLHIRKSKTGKRRDVLCRSNAGERLMSFLSFQNGYMPDGFEASDDCLIFGKPEDLLMKTYSYVHIGQQWRKVIETKRNELEGNRFSERPYTLYSLRATFIEDCIADGLDVYLVARLCGNSVEVIQRYYDRHDVLKRAEEVQALPIGVTKAPEPEVVDLSVV